MLPIVAGEFRVAGDPNLRFAPSGIAVCNIRAVASKRKKNENDEWVDDKVCWVNITGFKKVAENMAESFEKGDLVVVIGRESTDEWTNDSGETKVSMNVTVDYIGHSVSFNPARSIKGERKEGSGTSGASRSSSPTPPANDPWGSAGDEPPF